MTLSDFGLRILLGILAFYHLGIGVVSAFWPERTYRVAGALYAIQVTPDLPLNYAVRMLGLYALTFSYLLTLAALHPARYPDTIRACILLLLLRAAWRLRYRQEFTRAFSVTPRRNLGHALLLLAEAGLLLAWFPA